MLWLWGYGGLIKHIGGFTFFSVFWKILCNFGVISSYVHLHVRYFLICLRLDLPCCHLFFYWSWVRFPGSSSSAFSWVHWINFCILFYFFCWLFFFLMEEISSFLKVFIEFVTILLLFYVLVFWPRGMCGLSFPTGDQTRTRCAGRWSLNHWTTREVPLLLTLYLCFMHYF